MELSDAAAIVAGNEASQLEEAENALRQAGYSEEQLANLRKGLYIGSPDAPRENKSYEKNEWVMSDNEFKSLIQEGPLDNFSAWLSLIIGVLIATIYMFGSLWGYLSLSSKEVDIMALLVSFMTIVAPFFLSAKKGFRPWLRSALNRGK